MMKVVIIGGVAGGATAAARLRRLDENAQIIILERSGYVSYANCGLPYYIGKEITERTELTLQTPQSFEARFNVDVRVNEEVIDIDTSSKTVTVKKLKEGSIYTESYDKLILSPGAKPIVPDIPGVEGKRVLTLRTVEDTFKIYDYIDEYAPKSAVVVGGGFIGLEMAENLINRNLKVTLLQRSAQVMPPLDADMAAIVHNYMRKMGVDLKLKSNIKEIIEEKDAMTVKLEDGGQYNADFVVLAVGVLPENTLAKKAGLKLGLKGAICTDECMRTSNEDIYAVGDAVEVTHFVSQKKAVISLAGPANKQGRIAADNICGLNSRFTGSQGSSVLKLFNMTIASTGLNEKQAKELGYKFDYVVLTSASHATYYPGAASMTVKVLFDLESGRILGGQIIGFGGADKRIDVLAVAIRANMTAYDLTQLDLAYAPPFSSAKDPVNMAGYAIENILKGLVKQVHWQDIIHNIQDDVIFLDARTAGEYNRGHIQGCIHIPVDELRGRLNELPKDKKIYVYCQSGLRSYIACRILSQDGFDCYNVSGGYGFYNNILKGSCLDPEGTGPCGLKGKGETN